MAKSPKEKDLKELPFIFIVGRPRSGTTLLMSLFDAHPNVIIPPECAMILNLFPKYRKLRNWDKKHLLSFYNENECG